MDHQEKRISKWLTKAFEDQITQVQKNGVMIPFSCEKILSDLILSGISSFDALDTLEEILPHLKNEMKTEKITQLLYKILSDKGYSESEILIGTFQQPIVIIYGEEEKIFSYKEMKKFVKNSLVQFSYSSKTYRAVVNELSRIVMTIRSSRLKSNTIENMMPAVLRNTIGINPFSSKRCDDDYRRAEKIHKSIMNIWSALPDNEKPMIFLNFCEAAFRVILLSYEHLPGISLGNTIYQIEELVTDLSAIQDNIMTDREIYFLGKTAKFAKDVMNYTSKLNDIDEGTLFERINVIFTVVQGLMHRGSIKWLVITDPNGNELYSKFSSKQSNRSNKSLIAMAISGVQSIVTEITDHSVAQIEQHGGDVILIERRKDFSILSLVSQNSHLIKQKFQELAQFVENELCDELKHFTGNVNIFNQKIGSFVDTKLNNLIE